MDIINSAAKFVDRDRYKSAAIAATVGIGIWLAACDSTTTSLSGDRQVDRETFAAEVESEKARLEAEKVKITGDGASAVADWNAKATTLNARAKAGETDLDKKDAAKAEFVNLVGGVGKAIAEGTLSTSGIIGALVTAGTTLFSVGAVVDGRRKDKKIADAKKGAGQ